jgi:hypothetical protein
MAQMFKWVLAVEVQSLTFSTSKYNAFFRNPNATFGLFVLHLICFVLFVITGQIVISDCCEFTDFGNDWVLYFLVFAVDSKLLLDYFFSFLEIL